ncbi:MAG: DUF6624 domain-containing protein [Maricaulaceae bacterium]
MRRFIYTALFMAFNVAAVADPVNDLPAEPTQAMAFDYCDWVFNKGGDQAKLPDYKTLLDSKLTTLPPEEYVAMLLTDAGVRIATNAASFDTCKAPFEMGDKMFSKQIKASTQDHQAQVSYKKSRKKHIAKTQAEIAELWIEDQSARRVFINSRTEDEVGAEHWLRVRASAHTALVDEKSTVFMKNLLEQYDWIDRRRFGDKISSGAWILVQHADNHVELQSLALSRMEPYLKKWRGIDKGNYAYLWDRVAVNSDRKQRYGTQPTWECNEENMLTLQPLEDPENVNKRRKKMDLNTVEAGLARMSRGVCGAP